jgi:phosphatidate phosphatase PAH1
VQPLFSGVMDPIIVEQGDGSLKTTPFHLRIGKPNYLKFDNFVTVESEKYMQINMRINGQLVDPVVWLNMATGIAYFREVAQENELQGISSKLVDFK